jgi:hypothetical protein
VKFNPKYSITAGILLIVLKVSQWILQWPNPEPSSAYFWDVLQFVLATQLIYSGFKRARE